MHEYRAFYRAGEYAPYLRTWNLDVVAYREVNPITDQQYPALTAEWSAADDGMFEAEEA
jgi:hypothetical protein